MFLSWGRREKRMTREPEDLPDDCNQTPVQGLWLPLEQEAGCSPLVQPEDFLISPTLLPSLPPWGVLLKIRRRTIS